MDNLIAVVGILFGSSGLATVISLFLQRHWNKKDAKEKQQQIDPEQFKALLNAEKLLMAYMVHYLGTCFIYQKYISLDEKESLHEMHDAYKALGGNGHLDTVMDEVDKLEIKAAHDVAESEGNNED